MICVIVVAQVTAIFLAVLVCNECAMANQQAAKVLQFSDGPRPRPRGRPKRFAEYDELVVSCPKSMRRPRYLNNVGVRRGPQGAALWIKIHLPYGGRWKSKSYKAGQSVEIKLGRVASIGWQEAVRRKDELQSRADAGQALEELEPTSFDVFADDWLERKNNGLKSPETPRIHVRVHLNPEFGGQLLSDVTSAQIERWQSRMLAKDLSPGYVKRVFTTLRSILNDAVRNGLIQGNPCQFVKRIRGNNVRTRFLTSDEILVLLQKAGEIEPWFADAIEWALHSGMRRGEIQNLTWADVTELSDGRWIAIISNTKSGRSRRVTATQTMVEILERQKRREKEGDSRVWPNSPTTWKRKWEKIRNAAGMKDVNFHDLRRTNATLSAVSGIDLRTLAGRLGHVDLEMLERHYAMFVAGAETEAANSIEAAFRSLK